MVIKAGLTVLLSIDLGKDT